MKAVEENFNKVWSSDSPTSEVSTLDQKELDLFIHCKRALDLGSGRGGNAILLAKKGIQITCLELSSVGIKKTKELAKCLPLKIIKCDLFSKLPFKDGTFDLVLAYQSLNHNSKDKILSTFCEVKRVLKKGGIFSIRIANRETFRLKRIQGDIFLDEDYHVKFQMLDNQTFKGLSGDEEGIILYAFYEDELINDLTRIGFRKLNSRKSKFHIIANYS